MSVQTFATILDTYLGCVYQSRGLLGPSCGLLWCAEVVRCARARPSVTHSCPAVDRGAQDRAPSSSVQPRWRAACNQIRDLCFEKGACAFDVLVAWMVAEGYLGQLEAASKFKPRLEDLQLETDSTSSTGSDEMMQGAATDPLSSPEVVTNTIITIVNKESFMY